MEIQELMRRIHLSEDEMELVNHYEMSEKEYLEWKKLFETDVQLFLKKAEEIQGFEQMLLYLYIRFAADVQIWYRYKEIPDEIYIQTMKDIAVWSNHYKRTHKYPGIKATEWISHSIQGRVFRLGRLQFEPSVLEKDIITEQETYLRGRKILHVHIPEDGRLSKEACSESFAMAEDFFQSFGFQGENVYLCESWLLSPVLKKILEDKSNILDFQKRFYVYDVVYPFRQAEERIFGGISDDIETYPESTSLQRKFKQWLREHPEDIGMGIGVFSYINQ